MSAEAIIKVQMEARQNAVELNDYLKDLNSWEEDIKKKDKTYKEMKPNNKGPLVPPVRSGIKVEKVKKEQKEKVKEKRLRSNDYNAWDKLDVDKMIENIEEEEEIDQSIKKEEKAEKLEKDLLELCLEEKEKGNNHFKSGSYQKALECYTKGMQYDPSNPILPANRAMTYLKMKKWVETEADCTLSLSLDPAYVKAYLRRGTTRMEMGKVGSAERDFNDALKLEPENKQAQNELNKIANMGKKENKSATTSNKAVGKASFASKWKKSQRINAVIRPYNRRSKKPLRRIPVQEIGASLECDDDTSFVSKVVKVETPSVSASSGRSLIEEIQVKETKKTTTNVQKQAPKPTASKPKSVEISNPVEIKTKAAKNELNPIPPVPQISARFRSDMSSLKRRGCNDADIFQYLNQINPSSLGNLIKNDLDADLFEMMVAALKPFAKTHADFVLEFLQNVSLLKRFKTTLLCLEDSAEQDLKNIFMELADQILSEGSQLHSLQKLYRCC